MLLLTQVQLDHVGERIWEDEMVESMQRFAPRLFQVRGPEPFRTVIRQGLARARAHGLSTRGPVRLFIETMASLGHRFDEDPQLPAIAAALRPSADPEKERAQQLYRAILDTIDRVLGPGGGHAVAALTRLRDDEALWREAAAIPPAAFEDRMLADMHAIFPHKAAHVGEPTLRRLCDTALEHAQAHELPAVPGARVLAALMFALGWHVATDPLYPWISAMLEHRARTPRYDRAAHLAAKARIYLTATLAHLQGGP